MTESRGERLLNRYGPAAIVAAIFAFMVWLRTMPAGRMIKENAVFYNGNDPYYHMRMVHYVVRHFPSAPAFDPWSLFPFGTGRHSGFGALFDQIIASAAIILGIGDPSNHLINVVGAYAPVFFGALTIVPVYFIVKSFTDRWTAVFSVLLLSLFTGQFLQRSMVANPDHQSAEALFGAIAVVSLIYAYRAAIREKLTVAHFKDRDIDGVKKPVITCILAGVGIASYLMLWPPAVMLIFTFEVFVIIQLAREHWEGNSTEYFTLGVSISMVTAAIINLGYAKEFTLSSTAASLLQVLVPLGVAITAIYLHYLSNWFDKNDYDRKTYPVAVVGTILAGLIVTAVVFPKGISMLMTLFQRIYSFGLLTSPSALTVAEIAPASLGNAWVAFGAMFFVAIAGGIVMAVRVITKNRPTELLMILWAFTMFSAYFTMIRFGYYTAVNVAVLSAFLFAWIIKDVLDLSLDDFRGDFEIEGYQAIILVLMFFLILPGNVVAMSSAQPGWDRAPHLSGYNNPWMQELGWMQNGTFDPADASPKMGEKLEYYGAYQPPKDMNFKYPVGDGLKSAYGIMSWWDYGHWITFKGHRIPAANPFQQGQRVASDFLVSQTDKRANLVLDALPSLRSEVSANKSNSKLQSLIDNQNKEQQKENIRYVMIDDQMAAGKFNPIATWTRKQKGGVGTYYSRENYEISNNTLGLRATNDKYDNTTLSKLYFDDANGMSHYRLVHETERYSLIGSSIDIANQRAGELNKIFTRNSYDAPLTGRLTMRQATRLPEKQTIRAAANTVLYDVKVAASVKTFERVKGAKLVGETDNPNTPVTVVGDFETTNTKRNFSYQKTAATDSNGDFNVTVPYSTKGNVPVKQGGTDSAVEAKSPYVVAVGQSPLKPQEQGLVNVTDEDVLKGNTVNVELTEMNQTNIGDQETLEINPNNSTQTNSTKTNTTETNTTENETGNSSNGS